MSAFLPIVLAAELVLPVDGSNAEWQHGKFCVLIQINYYRKAAGPFSGSRCRFF